MPILITLLNTREMEKYSGSFQLQKAREIAWLGNDKVGIRWYNRTETRTCTRMQCSPYGNRRKQKSKFLYSPGQILYFMSPQDDTTHAIIKCCHYKFKNCLFFNKMVSRIHTFSKRNENSQICHLDVKLIVGHVLMIPYNKEKDSYIQI